MTSHDKQKTGIVALLNFRYKLFLEPGHSEILLLPGESLFRKTYSVMIYPVLQAIDAELTS